MILGCFQIGLVTFSVLVLCALSAAGEKGVCVCLGGGGGAG